MSYTEQELLDNFGVTDEETGEVVVDRNALLKSLVERGVYILNEQDTLKEDLKAVVNEAGEYDFDKVEVKALIKHVYKNTIQSEIDALQEIQVKIDNLFGDNNE